MEVIGILKEVTREVKGTRSKVGRITEHLQEGLRAEKMNTSSRNIKDRNLKYDGCSR